MLLQVQDAASNVQIVVAHAQDVAADSSGSISVSGTPQEVFPQNPARSGWIFQNLGVDDMYINELGNAAVGAGSFVVRPFEFFPPPNYPVPVGNISVLGRQGDAYTAREW
jgi:hypothetical protein